MSARIVAALLLHAWLFVGAAPCCAQDVYADFLRKSGLWNQMADVHTAIEQGIDANDASLDARGRDALRRAAAQSYDADRLRGALRTRLAEALPTDDASRALAWLDTPLGRRITTAEETASRVMADASPGFDAAAKAYASVAATRKAILQRLMSAIDAGEAAATIIVNSIAAINRGVAALGGASRADAASDADARMKVLHAQIKAAIEPQLIAMQAIVYAPFSDDEMEQYVGFLESDAGRRVSKAVNAALDAVLTSAALDFGQRVARDAANEAAKANQT